MGWKALARLSFKIFVAARFQIRVIARAATSQDYETVLLPLQRKGYALSESKMS
jgi:hypothetical protein